MHAHVLSKVVEGAVGADCCVQVQGLARRWAHKSNANLQDTRDLAGNCVRDVDSGQWVVAPRLEGRMVVYEPGVAAAAASPTWKAVQ
jgi:hypothetical protein